MCEQVLSNVCVLSRKKEENLIIPVIKAIIRKNETLTQKRLSWKASQLNLQQPIKRVIKCSHSARTLMRDEMHTFTEPIARVSRFT